MFVLYHHNERRHIIIQKLSRCDTKVKWSINRRHEHSSFEVPAAFALKVVDKDVVSSAVSYIE